LATIPSNPGPGPTPAGPVVYRDGDSCPACGQAVAVAQLDPPPLTRGGPLVQRARAATLLPCGHRVDRVLPPGNRPPRS
jgi:hypothetical protein